MELTEEMLRLLTKVIAKRCPEFKWVLDRPGDVRLDDERAFHCVLSAVTDELCERGFSYGYEPTKKGLILESLIDYVNTFRPGTDRRREVSEPRKCPKPLRLKRQPLEGRRTKAHKRSEADGE